MAEEEPQYATTRQLEDVLAALLDQIAAVRDELTAEQDEAKRAGRWRWETLEGEERADLWYELRDFIGWYNTTIGRQNEHLAIWGCWPGHPVVVEVMTAQLVAWKAAHRSTVPTDAIRLWFEHLWPAVAKIHDLDGNVGGLGKCAAKHHETNGNAVGIPPVDPADFDTLVREDVEAHSPVETDAA
ncbi:hypothetical protein [Luteimicrobium sp. DT211]|uniref:hypothetical protein n=1 Tax=Luteimicrobium sp. DT211 TaxID=3393412 RepID=UPI003CF55F2F